MPAAQDTLATVRAGKRAIAEQTALAQRNFEVDTATVTDMREAQASRLRQPQRRIDLRQQMR